MAGTRLLSSVCGRARALTGAAANGGIIRGRRRALAGAVSPGGGAHKAKDADRGRCSWPAHVSVKGKSAHHRRSTRCQNIRDGLARYASGPQLEE